MRIDVVTIFPGLFDSFLETSLVGKARDGGEGGDRDLGPARVCRRPTSQR